MLDSIQQALSELFNTESVVGMVVSTALPAALTGIAAYAYGKHRERSKHKDIEKSLQDNKLETESVLFSVTYFHPTGETNPETGEPIKELRIINTGQAPLATMFKDETQEYWVKYVKEAQKRCTNENPCVLLHLADVIPDSVKNKDAIIENFVNDCLNFSSDLMHESKQVVRTVSSLEEDEAPRQTNVLPVLIFEEGVTNRQLRMLLIPEAMLKPGGLPKMENTRFRDFDEDGNIIYRGDEKLHHAMRLKTMQRIAGLYDQNKRLFNRNMVNVITNEVVKVEPRAYSANDNDSAGDGWKEITGDAAAAPEMP